MKLDLNCIRDILLALEQSKLDDYITLNYLSERLPNYEEDVLTYNCLKLEEADFLTLITVNMLGQHLPGIKQIVDVTFDGHQYLNNIRDQNIWNSTLDKLKTVGGTSSLAIISSVAEKTISKMLGL